MANSQKAGWISGLKLDTEAIHSLAGNLDQVLTGENVLTSARKKQVFEKNRPPLYSSLRCQLCQMPIYGTSYEKLADGRICCHRCAESRIQSQEELESLFKECKQNFISFFGVELPAGIHLYQTLPDKAPADFGEAFWLNGFGQLSHQGLIAKNGEEYTAWLENGISASVTLGFIVEILSAIWMMENWDMNALRKICQEKSSGSQVLFTSLIEGMEQWASVQYLMFAGERTLAKDLDHLFAQQEKPASAGYRLLKKTYPLASSPDLMTRTPFHNWVPVDLDRLKAVLEIKNS